MREGGAIGISTVTVIPAAVCDWPTTNTCSSDVVSASSGNAGADSEAQAEANKTNRITAIKRIMGSPL